MSIAPGVGEVAAVDGAVRAEARFRALYGRPEAEMTLAQRDLILTAWPPEAQLIAAFVEDPPGGPALVVLSDLPGATPMSVSAAGDMRPGKQLPAHSRFVVDRAVLAL